MCQCKECSNKEMELTPEFEGIFGNEFEMEINPEFGIPDFITNAAKNIVSPVLEGAQNVVSPFYNWMAGNTANTQVPLAERPIGNGAASSIGGIVGGLNTVRGSFVERLQVHQVIKTGNRNENALTDMVFFNRHPELGRKLLHKSMPNFSALSKEWLNIRDNIVRPFL